MMKQIFETHDHYTRDGIYIQYDFQKTLVYLRNYAHVHVDPHFKFDKSDIEILKKLFVYSIEDLESCDQFNINPRKGILLIGPVGCGKTSLMKVFNHLAIPSKKFTMRPTRDISIEFIQDGYPVLHKYGKSIKNYCFDDLGVEQNMKHFGNECNVMGEILLSRYDLYKTTNLITHATTNLNADELEKIYGNRVRSRLREMFNLVAFPESTKDKRK